jgi:hypothetical protein
MNGVGFHKREDFPFNAILVGIQLIDMIQAFPQFDGLFRTDSAVNSILNLINRSFAVSVNEWCDIEFLTGVGKDVLGNRPSGLSENIREHIIQFQAGNGQTILSTVLLAGQHIRQLGAVTDKITKMANIWRRDKGWLDHATHEQVADPTGILSVGFVSLLWFGVLGMRKGYLAGFLQYIEHRNPVLASGFHADFLTVVFLKPGSQAS